MNRLFLVRHGESEWNAEGRLQGQADPALSALGREQSRALALPDGSAVSSDLIRATLTAELAGFSGAPTDARWRERTLGEWETFLEREVATPEQMAAFRRGELIPPGGEAWPEFQSRVTAAAAELTEDTIVFTHGGCVRALVAEITGADYRAVAGPANASITVLRMGRRPRMLAFNWTATQPGSLAPSDPRGPMTLEELARTRLGIERLRPGQAEVARAVIEGRDALAIMATGYGKSAIYQLAGLALDGPTLVISPLIALQRDQVEQLQADDGLGGAAAISSVVPEWERDAALTDAGDDRLEFLFMAPEQLANPDVLADVRAAEPSLMVVDEAHCISEWGHDFRPEYLRLGAVAEQIGRPIVLGLTATASPPVREEIVARLGLRDPLVAVHGFDRPNLHFAVERFHDERAKERALAERVRELAKPGIVYTATRRDAERLADELSGAGINSAAYHGAMAAGLRDDVQSAFMDDQLDVIVATTAFGMGVDKPNVRFVVHHAVADAVDSYWQEVGRAGRDGEPAAALLLYRSEDLGLRRFFAGAGQVDATEIEKVAEAIADARGPAEPTALQEETELSASKLATAVGRLEDVGAVTVEPDGTVAATDALDGEAVVAAAEVQADREAFDRSRVDMMRAYAELQHACRREFLLSYFGEATDGPCGNCDLCEAGDATPAPDDSTSLRSEAFPVGARVRHPKWGEATVQRYEEDKVVVLFDAVGYKALALDVVRDNDLLEPA